MSDYYILSLKWTRSGEECVTWWGPDNSGYVESIDKAGRYSEARVRANPSYYDNRTSTLAIPCEVAEKYIQRCVRVGRIEQMVSEALGGLKVRIDAPMVDCTDDLGRPVDCKWCGHRPQSPGSSVLVLEKPQATKEGT
jgi:hypothetical protein